MPIKPITMPKWGLAMEEGALARWAVEEGAEIALGQEIMDIETTKIANVFESPVAGVLRQKGGGGGRDRAGRRAARRRLRARRAGRRGGKIRRRFPGKLQAAGEGLCRRADAGDRSRRAGKRIRYLKAGPDDGHADPADPRLRRRPDGLDVQPGRPRRRPPGLCDRPSRPWRLVEGRRRRLGARRSPRRSSRLHGRGGDRDGASRRPFARRRHRDADRGEVAGARRGADADRAGGLRAGDRAGIHRRLHRRDAARESSGRCSRCWSPTRTW